MITKEELLGQTQLVETPMFKVGDCVMVTEYELALIQLRTAKGELDPGLLVEDMDGNTHCITDDGSIYNEEGYPVIGLALLPHLRSELMRIQHENYYERGRKAKSRDRNIAEMEQIQNDIYDSYEE